MFIPGKCAINALWATQKTISCALQPKPQVGNPLNTVVSILITCKFYILGECSFDKLIKQFPPPDTRGIFLTRQIVMGKLIWLSTYLLLLYQHTNHQVHEKNLLIITHS